MQFKICFVLTVVQANDLAFPLSEVFNCLVTIGHRRSMEGLADWFLGVKFPGENLPIPDTPGGNHVPVSQFTLAGKMDLLIFLLPQCFIGTLFE